MAARRRTVPKPRSHAIELQKKVRLLGLKHALSAKAKANGLIVIEDTKIDAIKTKALREQFAGLGVGNALIIDNVVDAGFAKAARNIPMVDVLPVAGLNVYDIMRRDTLVLTRAALDGIEARFSGTPATAAETPAEGAN